MKSINQPRSNSGMFLNLRSLGYSAIIATLLNVSNPSIIKADSVNLNIGEKIEQIDNRNVVDRVQQATGVKLPGEYDEAIRDFVQFGDAFNDQEVCEYTINFICSKMKTSLGSHITNENKLLGIRCKIFVCLYNESPYDGGDNDKERLEQFKTNIDFFDRCGEEYSEGIKAMTRRRIANADKRIEESSKRIAEADKKIEEAKKRIAEADKKIAKNDEEKIKLNYEGLENIVQFFQIWEDNPDIVRKHEIEQSIKYAKNIVESCKRYNINYKDERLKKLKDEKRLNKMLELLKIK